MTKFNVGDKVRFIEDYMDYKKGDIVEVVGFWDEGINYIGKGKSAGCYFSRVELVETKPTKNQRITALENEVAELKLIVHELRGKKSIDPSTSTIEDIIEFEGKQYRKVDREAHEGDVIVFYGSRHPQITDGKPYKVFKGKNIEENKLSHTADSGTEYPVDGEYVDGYYVYELIEGGLNPQISIVDETIEPLTQNQQRAAIIEKARKFVDEHKSKYRSEWNIVGHTVQILIYDSNGMLMKFRQAKCNPSDVFNEHIGKAIALGRALGLDVSEFEQAVLKGRKYISIGHLMENYLLKIKNSLRAISEHKSKMFLTSISNREVVS